MRKEEVLEVHDLSSESNHPDEKLKESLGSIEDQYKEGMQNGGGTTVRKEEEKFSALLPSI